MEQWRDIPGYEGIYQASNMGNIRTCEGKTTYSKRHGLRHWKQRFIKQRVYFNSRGRADARVILWKDGKEKTWLVSRLVGLAWCTGYGEGMTINHINGDHHDNRSANLEWVTLSENIKKGFETGLFSKNQISICLHSEGNDLLFPSMAEASRYIGRNQGYVSACVIKNKCATSKEGKRYTVEVKL